MKRAKDGAGLVRAEGLEPRVLFAAVVPRAPFGGTAPNVPGVIQAENFDEGGEGVAYHDLDAVNRGGAYRDTGVDVEEIHATGGGFALDFAKAGEWTEYTFNVPAGQAGAYEIFTRYAALKQSGIYRLHIDGKAASNLFGGPTTGSWQTYQQANPGSNVFLSEGAHVLRLTQWQNDSTGFVANFDSIEFVRRRETFTGSPFFANQTIEAENFDKGGETVTYHDTDAANVGGAYRPADGVDIEATADAGGGFNVGFAKAGEWMEYTVSILNDGLYGIDARVASLRAGGKFHFEIDGVAVASFDAPSTGSWQNYTTLSSAKNIHLAPGGHRLRLQLDANNSTGYVANFNWFRVVS